MASGTSGAAIIGLCGQPKGVAIRYTVDDTIAVAKGDLMQITNPVTATLNETVGNPFAGIAASEKEANDGQVTLGVWTKGIFDLHKDPCNPIAIGDLVSMSGCNLIRTADEADISGGAVVGKALEDAAAGSGEVIAVAVGIY